MNARRITGVLLRLLNTLEVYPSDGVLLRPIYRDAFVISRP